MRYYHGSPQGGLTRLTPRVSPVFGGEKVVYLTSLLPMALMYTIRHFEYTYGYHWQDERPGQMFYEEYYPNALQELYGGKRGFLYVCETGDYQSTKKPNEWVSKQPVVVLDVMEIQDALEALLEQERAGYLRIRRFDTLTKKDLVWVRATQKETILKMGLITTPESDFARFMQEKYPDSWQDALKEYRRTGSSLPG